MKFKVLALALLFVFALPVFAQDTPEASMDTIVIDLPGSMPEGVEYDAAGGRFLFGSLTQGTISQVADGGIAESFIEDKDLVSSAGLQVDVANNRLLVTNANFAEFLDPEAQGVVALAAYNLKTGDRLYYTDLGGLLPDSRHGGNDVAVDDKGNAYVTDSLAPVIYRIDPEGNAEIFIEDELLTNENFGLNGIAYHPDGYLLAAVSGAGAIYRIPLDDPSTLVMVELSEPLGIDGMVLTPDGDTLYAVASNSSGAQELVQVTSADDWATAEVTARAETGGNATTVALRDGVPYYINIYFGNPEAEQYEIVPVIFEED